MLHNTAREYLLQAKRTPTAMVIDGLYKVGWREYSNFNFDDAQDALAAFGMSDKIIRAGLNDPLFKPEGRRKRFYTLPAASTVRASLGAAKLPFRDELPDTAFASPADYRAAIHYAMILRKPGFYSRKMLARRLGVCRVTTLNYDRRLGIVVTPNVKYEVITDGTVHNLPAQRQHGFRNSWLEGHAAPNVQPQRAPVVRGQAMKWLNMGWIVVIATQQTNHYSIFETSPDERMRKHWDHQSRLAYAANKKVF